MRYLDEQLRLYQTDCVKAREENNDLRSTNNAELSQVVENYESELNKARAQLEEMGARCSELVVGHERQMTELKIEHENLLNEFDKIFQLNKELNKELQEGKNNTNSNNNNRDM